MHTQTVGSRIKEARIKRYMTQEQLSQIVGIKRATISAYEKGKITPPLEKINTIAEALQCTPGYLLGVKDSLVNEHEARLLEKLYDAAEGTLQELTRPYTALEAAEVKLAQQKIELRNKRVLFFLSQLNNLGQEEAIKRLEEMTMIPKYQRTSPEGGNDYGQHP